MSQTVKPIPVAEIAPSPFQHRRNFDEAKLSELAKSIQEHGLIQPVVVRPNSHGYEMICGERRLRACQLIGQPTILAIVRKCDDKQARIACLSENVQRADLSKVEEIEAIAEWLDAFMDSNEEGYRAFLSGHLKSEGKAGRKFKIASAAPDLEKPLHRTALLLTLFESDRKNGTAISSKFTANLTASFEALKKGIDPLSFATNDLPTILKLEKYEEIKQAAIQKDLNKSQVESIVRVAESHGAKAALEIVKSGIRDSASGKMIPIEDSSAREIERDHFNKSIEALVLKFTGDDENYTPAEFLDQVRAVLGEIDLDPASNEIAQKTVKASTYFGKDKDGLLQPWAGRVFLNPPFSNPLIADFIKKLVAEYKSNRVTAAILLTNDNTDTEWFQMAASECGLFCLRNGRISFYKSDGVTRTSPTNGQTVFYFGSERAKFKEVFSSSGLICKVI